jgi:hypothetical protein
VGPIPYFFLQRHEEAIVTKSGVGYNHGIRLVPFHSDPAEHFNGLDMLTLEVNRLALECWFLFFERQIAYGGKS